jgi:hypothetical protein
MGSIVFELISCASLFVESEFEREKYILRNCTVTRYCNLYRIHSINQCNASPMARFLTRGTKRHGYGDEICRQRIAGSRSGGMNIGVCVAAQ